MPEIRGSAAYRIALVCSAAFALAILVLGAAVYFAANAEFRRQRDAGIAGESVELARTFTTEGRTELLEAIATREAGGSAHPYGYALFDARGRRVAGGLDTTRPSAGWSDIVFHDPAEGPDPARASATPLPGGEMLVVAVDSEPLEQIDRTILTLFAAAFAVVLLLGVMGALLLGGYLRRRLARIGDTAQAIVGGDLARRMPIGSRNDEFDALAASLNAMLDRIQQLLDNLRQVSSDVAHDLRTPLARLRGSLEEALAAPADRLPLKKALRQSDELLSLFAAILRISEIEGGALERSFTALDVAEFARDIGESYLPAIADGGRTLAIDIAEGAMVRGDRELIAQAIINLLDNAQAHTPAGTAITLAATPDGTDVRLSVADDGHGVPEPDRARIARRFVRLESSRTTPGNGLGLNLAAAIATAHGGTLDFADNAPGLRVTITLPGMPS